MSAQPDPRAVERANGAERKGPLAHVRIADLSGQLAGAGATRFLAAMGADVIRVEDPSRQGRWDILRGSPPYVDERRGIELGGAFNNHNVEKRGVTINLKTTRGRELFAELVKRSDVVTENFAAGVLAKLGFSYATLCEIRPDIIYVSNSGFGHTGPYVSFKTWGPVVQAVCGLSFSSGLSGLPSAGIGYSYMDHHGGNMMAIAVLAALHHRARTGEGMWFDMACTEAGATLLGPALLDFTVNGRALRRDGLRDSNRSSSPAMAPHGVYASSGEDEWIAFGCRDDAEWARLASIIDQDWASDVRFATLAGRLESQDDLDRLITEWTRTRERHALAAVLQEAQIPAAAVVTPPERIDGDPNTQAWGLWPTVVHPGMGAVRVDGLPIHLSKTDWRITRGAPLLGQHNKDVFGDLMGLDDEALESLRAEGTI